ncbi:bifunctional DNA primase/polymerase [Pseudonocardia hispaniensis]|uniref:Bifunctional DNA primase/polymerase n=1 Tax=Pseudonocardia hispaniensis TaxID=904933 RepID=A0ABW1J7W1_9PSEU
MRIYSTCTVCDQQLMLAELGQTQHPNCQTSSPTGDPLADAFLAAVEADDQHTADQLAAQLDGVDQRPPQLGRAAVAYAELGWPVFPLQPGDKIPYPRSRGFKDATTNLDVVRRWWTNAPHCNIGVATGHMFDVLDVDITRKDGTPSGALWEWVELRDSGKLPDIHGISITPRGGLHVLFQPTGGGNLAGFRPGMDYRGRGGYIVAPPSRRADGRRYQWWVRPSPHITARGQRPVEHGPHAA